MSFNRFIKTVCLTLGALLLSACGSEPVAQAQMTPSNQPTTQDNPSTTPQTLTTPITEGAVNTQSVPVRKISEITFTDAKLAGCLETTAKTQNWQTVDQVITLNCANKGIGSVGGIQNLQALQTLDLQQNNISELAPLSKLKGLKSLNLAANKLVNIDPLQGLTQLSELNLGSAGQLDISGNSIRDIAALAGLGNLNKLNLNHNQVNDLSALKRLSKLENLALSGNQIRDITALLDLPPLAKVNLFGNDNIACAEVNELETALFEGDLKRPADCIFTLDIQITDIFFSDNQLKTCILDTASSEGWITIGEMTELICDQQQITDLGGLQNLKALNHLDLTSNDLIDISPLFELTHTNSILLGTNEKIACSRLDALEAELGSGVISRPAACAPVTLISDLDFVDPVLEACVEHSAYQYGWQTIDQMVTLECPNKIKDSIEDLRGIEQLTALESVDLKGRLAGNGEGIDISALFSLKQDIKLDLSQHSNLSCQDIDALASILNADINKPANCS